MVMLMEGVVGRTIVLFGSSTDPDPELTWSRGVTLLVLDGVDKVSGLAGPVGVAGWSTGGLNALGFAARNRDLVDRLVLLATPIPEDESGLGFDPSEIEAKALLLFGAKDPRTGSRHGAWWQKRLPDARLEMNPQAGHDLLTPMWKRTLSHLAPRCKR